MNVAFCLVTDRRGLELACYSALSLATSQRHAPDIHIFGHRFVPELAGPMGDALRASANLVLHEVSDASVENHRTHGHVTTPTLLKPAAVARLMRDYRRVAYFDSDMLVFGDLDLAGLDLGGRPLAAVVDMDLSPSGAIHHARLQPGDYFNAGLLIFDRSEWREAATLAAYAASLERHKSGCVYKADCTSIDQCALNDIYAGRWLDLPATYNMQASAKFTPFWQHALVRHYCGPRKFLVASPFRSDGREVTRMAELKRAAGQPASGPAALYDLLFRLNVARHWRNGGPIRELLRMTATLPRYQGHPELRLEMPD